MGVWLRSRDHVRRLIVAGGVVIDHIIMQVVAGGVVTDYVTTPPDCMFL